MKSSDRVAAFLVLLLCGSLAPGALGRGAEGFPERPVRLLVPYPPGGTADLLARIIAQKLSDNWGTTIVVDNRGGAGGNIATEMVARAEPDGYTLLMCNAPVLAINPALYKSVSFDPVKDFAPINGIAEVPLILLVNPAVPVKTFDEFIPYVRARKGDINYASGSVGSTTHLSMELFKSMAKVELNHIPYKGSGPALAAIIAGQVPVMFELMPSANQFVKTDRLRALAVTSAKRSPLMPALPTIAEKGLPGYEVASWFGLCAPRGTPRPIINRVSENITAILQTPDMQERFAGLGAQPMPMTADQFSSFIKSEIGKWSKTVRDSHARVE